jgi:hypothetical protein
MTWQGLAALPVNNPHEAESLLQVGAFDGRRQGCQGRWMASCRTPKRMWIDCTHDFALQIKRESLFSILNNSYRILQSAVISKIITMASLNLKIYHDPAEPSWALANVGLRAALRC